ncbi:heat-shock protein Hsp20 [Candidatus Tenderia electrophaga]|jgi:HSP20 family protein|uniref:Heat-shock protein Hsp20 n=1 Tax=Candidatus Tenderia electrophaga TaxID=1748243 RepID=A0A0S2TA60_9GAMM|nr:heat-shock protein Hsp20 [Candidatus Tenderia electrophaga]
MAKSEKKDVAKSGGQELQSGAGRGLSPFEDMERMFETFFGQSWPRRFMRPFEMDWGNLPAPFEGRTPKVDVINRDKEVVIKAELPGVKKEDLDISVSDDSVTIRASTKHERKEEEGEYYRRETSSGEFVRTLALPAEVDGAKAKAEFKDGVLELTAPKVVASKRHKVSVS